VVERLDRAGESQAGRSAAETEARPKQDDFYDELEKVEVWTDEVSALSRKVDIDLSSISQDADVQEKWLDQQLVEREKLCGEISSFPKNYQPACFHMARDLQSTFQRQFSVIKKARQEGSKAIVRPAESERTGERLDDAHRTESNSKAALDAEDNSTASSDEEEASSPSEKTRPVGMPSHTPSVFS
jgi:hypothetical protein